MFNNWTHIVGVKKEQKTERTAMRVTRTCRGLINAIGQRFGISDSSVIEIVVREYAEAHKIDPLYWDEASEKEG